MRPRQLSAVRRRLEAVLRESDGLARDSQRWANAGAVRRITVKRRDSMVELAFLRSFLAWERFLEESFLLYLLGKRPPFGRTPRRFAMPPDGRAARDFILEGREYAKWDESSTTTRAKRFFRAGQPFAGAIESRRHLLKEARTIRNAIAHESLSARDKFEQLVRGKLGILPPGTTIGGFLVTQVPRRTPPMLFFEFYLDGIRSVVGEIIPQRA